MHQHTHTGLVSFVYITVVAIVGLNLVRLAAAKMAESDKLEPVGKAVGALVHFGNASN